MPDENSQRIDRLESHLAHLGHQVEQLNGVVIEQGNLLDRLSKETRRQSGAMQKLELERMKSNVQKPPRMAVNPSTPSTLQPFPINQPSTSYSTTHRRYRRNTVLTHGTQ